MGRAGTITAVLFAAGAAGFASGLSACGGGSSTAGPSSLGGGYELRTVQDHTLPYLAVGDTEWGVRYLGGGLSVVGDSLFLYHTTDVLMNGAPSAPQTETRAARYERSGSRIVVIYTAVVDGRLQTSRDTGTVVGSEIRLAERLSDGTQIGTFVYVRQ